MQGLEERWATIAGARLRYEIGGDGPAVVLLHGLGGAASNWVELAPLLVRRHRVLVPDLPGHGGSEPLAGGLDAFADCIAGLAEHEGLLPAAMVGHSAGGSIALRLAARR